MSPTSFCIQCGSLLDPAASYCGKCGRPVNNPATPASAPPPPSIPISTRNHTESAEPRRGLTRERTFMLMGLGIVAIIIALVASNRHGTSTGSNVPPSIPSQLKLPSSQESFISIVSAAQSQSRSVANDMQRGGVKAARDKSLCAQFQSLDVTDWVGTVKTVDSNSDGKGVLAVEVAPGITIMTSNNAFSDIGSDTLIEPGSPVFQSASAMKRGERVRFSGTFLPGFSGSGDCLREVSLSLRGKVESPDFIFRFSNISPYLAGQQGATPIPSNAGTAPIIDGKGLSRRQTPEATAAVDADATWKDPATGLMWTRKDNGVDVTWQEAVDYCRNLQLSGQSDWRLPTINELQGIYDSTIDAPDQSSGGRAVPWQVKGKLVLSAWGIWSSSQGNAPGQAWVFGFGDGKPFSYRFDGRKKPRALCVRSSSSPPTLTSANDERAEQDARLNRIYQQLIAQLKPDEEAVQRLRVEERAWIKQRDAQCGTDQSCLARLIKERADELAGRLKTGQ